MAVVVTVFHHASAEERREAGNGKRKHESEAFLRDHDSVMKSKRRTCSVCRNSAPSCRESRFAGIGCPRVAGPKRATFEIAILRFDLEKKKACFAERYTHFKS
jgi:hypothetical protein